jgi:nitrogen fixation-related uncharacterized protein
MDVAALVIAVIVAVCTIALIAVGAYYWTKQKQYKKLASSSKKNPRDDL